MRVLYLWLAKVLYGIMYREVSLLTDRSSPTSGTIIDHQTLSDYEGLLFFLQEARAKIETVNFTPGSIFVFRMQRLAERQLEWDLCDNIDTLFIALHMGEVAILGVLGDGGAQQPFEEELLEFREIPLHPFQFRELCAQVAYRASLFRRSPKHITAQGAPHKVIQLPLGGFSLKPLFDEWQPDIYAQYLSHFAGVPLEMVRPRHGNVITWLYDDQMRPRRIDFKEWPQLPCIG
jgi:hypothetical protein